MYNKWEIYSKSECGDYVVWYRYDDHDYDIIYNALRVGKTPAPGSGGYYHLPALLDLKGIKINH